MRKDLEALGFGDNLQRTLPLSEWPSSEVLLATLLPLSRMALVCPGFIEAAIQEDIALEAGVGIVVRVGVGDSQRSLQAGFCWSDCITLRPNRTDKNTYA